MYRIVAIVLFTIMGCQRVPSKSLAVEPKAAKALAPMGSATNNAALEKKLADFQLQLKTTGLERQYALAEFYFNERRFIECAQITSGILDKDPLYKGARNLLARCFFFLGNPDRALKELEYILLNQAGDTSELVDALYLTGAVVLEARMMESKKLHLALKSFETYLKIVPNSPEKPFILNGLKILNTRLKKDAK